MVFDLSEPDLAVLEKGMIIAVSSVFLLGLGKSKVYFMCSYLVHMAGSVWDIYRHGDYLGSLHC